MLVALAAEGIEGNSEDASRVFTLLTDSGANFSSPDAGLEAGLKCFRAAKDR